MATRVTLRNLVDRWSCSTVVFVASIKLLQSVRRLGVRPREDGFRRSTRAFFRPQQAHPCMAVFGLDVGRFSGTSQNPEVESLRDAIATHLREFLVSRSDMQKCLRWGRLQTKIVDRTSLDLVQADFGVDGHVIEIRPSLDRKLPPGGLSSDVMGAMSAVLARAYNQTRHHADKRRPLTLQRALLRQVKTMTGTSRAARQAGACLADRLLNAIWISFEALPASSAHADRVDARTRLKPPPLRERLGPGPGGLVVMARMHPHREAVDLWFQFHHALCDGVPFAEMLADLEQRWGVAAPLVVPAPEPSSVPRPRMRCSGPGAPESWVVEDWLDFGPLLARRERLAARLAECLEGERISTIGLLIWGLAQEKVFKDIKFTVVLDVPAADGRERTLGIAPIRPAAFFDDRAPDAAFLAFNRELARRIQSTRERRSESYELVESVALLPASVYPSTLGLLGTGIRECVGTFGVSVIREAPVVMAAQGDIHVDGFLGVGRFDLPTESGGRAGVVMVKGPPDRIDAYLRAVRAVVACLDDPARSTM